MYENTQAQRRTFNHLLGSSSSPCELLRLLLDKAQLIAANLETLVLEFAGLVYITRLRHSPLYFEDNT
jgi:hypothetical protein